MDTRHRTRTQSAVKALGVAHSEGKETHAVPAVRHAAPMGIRPRAKGWPACPRCDSIDVWMQHLMPSSKWRLACHTCGLKDEARSHESAKTWLIEFEKEEEPIDSLVKEVA